MNCVHNCGDSGLGLRAVLEDMLLGVTTGRSVSRSHSSPASTATVEYSDMGRPLCGFWVVWPVASVSAILQTSMSCCILAIFCRYFMKSPSRSEEHTSELQ